jgi:acyl-CoA thioesterase
MTTQPPPNADDAQLLASAVGQAMWPRDNATQALGMTLSAIGPGTATMLMPVRRDMLNGHGICHGGLIFTLADSAFAYACNSYNLNAVASGCQIDFLAPAREGELLEAQATERAAAGRTGVYDIAVRVQGGRQIALFRGKSHRIGGDVIAGLQSDA